MVGTRDAEFMPECTRAWGIRVAPDRNTITILLSETFAGKTLHNLRENGMVAVTCARPTDHLTCQLKGHVQGIKPVTPEEGQLSWRWHREFSAELIAIGVSSTLCEGLIVEPTIAVDIDVTEVFDQTPGPGAGRKIEP